MDGADSRSRLLPEQNQPALPARHPGEPSVLPEKGGVMLYFWYFVLKLLAIGLVLYGGKHKIIRSRTLFYCVIALGFVFAIDLFLLLT